MDQLRGRVAPSHPTTILPSGYTVQVRRLAPGMVASLHARVALDRAGERPEPPAQAVAVGPGEERTVPNPGDPDYQEALAAWDAVNKQQAAYKLLRLIQDYALLTPTDADAVASYREAMAAVGVDAPDDDRELYVWYLVAPTPADQQALVSFVLGVSEPGPGEVAAARATFRGDLAGAAA